MSDCDNCDTCLFLNKFNDIYENYIYYSKQNTKHNIYFNSYLKDLDELYEIYKFSNITLVNEKKQKTSLKTAIDELKKEIEKNIKKNIKCNSIFISQ